MIRNRKIKDRLFFITVCTLSLLTAIPLVAILGKVFVKGFRQLNIQFFTESTPTTLDAMLAQSAGEVIPGGIANGIVGTLLIVLMASSIAIPLGIACGVYLSEHKNSKFASLVRFCADLLQGVPSIVIGIIGYIWIVVSLKSYSAIAGAGALTIMMLPLIVRSTEETLNMLPVSLKEAGLALGSSYKTMVMRVLLPSAFGGIFTGVLLAISRVLGETAPLMLTALGCATIQWNVTNPSSAVSLLIWEFYNDPNLQNMIWSASLFLLLFVLLLNVSAKKISKKWKI